MTTVFDVPPDMLLAKTAAKLEAEPTFAPPAWASVVKTGIHREKAPHNPNWWQTRVASLLRRVYIDGPVGVVHLAQHYGGTRDRGSKPNRVMTGSRSIVRHAMKQLEAGGYVSAIKGKGRIITGKGRKFMDAAAHETALQLEATRPELKKY